MHFYQEDVLTALNERAATLIALPDTVVLFDNGDKVKEVHMYAPMIADRGAFFVHDWPNEVSMSDIKGTADVHSFIPLYHKFAQRLVSHLRFFGKAQGA